MNNRNTVSISKNAIISLPLCYIISSILVVLLNHFGKFSYIADTTGVPDRDSLGRYYMNVSVPPTNPIASVTYTSLFGSKITTNRPGYAISEIAYKDDGEFYEYSNLIKYYINASVKDYLFILLFGTCMYILYLLFTNFNIKIY